MLSNVSSGRSVIASIRSSTRGLALASSASRRRCSITARASGLENGRSGIDSVLVSLVAVCPASSVATSVSLMLPPAQTCSVRSFVVLAAFDLPPRRGSDSGISGGP